MPLDIHPASEAERLAAYRNVHDVWSHGRPMEEHLAQRLRSVQHNRAEWFVGCLGGDVVTSSGAYPLWFHLHGEIVRGIAIGSVHTIAAHRAQGFAPRLIAWVEEHLRRRDAAAISLLYSDIPPDYYARQGYRLCPAHEGWTRPAAAANDDRRLIPLSAERDLPALGDMYSAFHGALPLAIGRPADYWQYLLRKGPADEFFWLTDAAGSRLGYVRLAATHQAWRITDYALARRDEGLLEELYRCVQSLAAERGAARVGGWLPDVPAARRCFAMQPRAKEVTMLKSLDGALKLSDEAVAAADWFCEADHV